MTAKIIPFPPLHLDRAHDPEAWMSKPFELWTKHDSVEEARYRVRTIIEKIEELESRWPLTTEERCTWAANKAVLPSWQERLVERECEAAGSALHYKGVVYAEPMGRA